MELKQKKTIYWSVVLTLLISIFLLILYNVYEEIFKEGIWNGLGMLFLLFVYSSLVLFLPSVLFYRVLIGKIPIDLGTNLGDYYFLFVFLLGILSFFMLEQWIKIYLINPLEEILPVLVVIILIYVVHKLFKRFVFELKTITFEEDNDKEYDEFLSQLKEELKKDHEFYTKLKEFIIKLELKELQEGLTKIELKELKEGLRKLDTKDWEF
jgi:hypothetical protein